MSTKFRIGAALALVFGLAMGRAEAATRYCFPEGGNQIVLSRGAVDWPITAEGAYTHGLLSTVFAVVNGAGSDASIDHVSIIIHEVRCEVRFRKTFKGDSARVQSAMLGSTPVIDLISEGHGASGNGFEHTLVVSDRSGLRLLQTPAFNHTNMGGFFIGSLGGGRGEGVVVWDAVWKADDPTHYSPHRYKFTFFRWNGTTFDKAVDVMTSAKFEANPDVAARGAGYSFKDQTGQDRMPIVFVGGPQ